MVPPEVQDAGQAPPGQSGGWKSQQKTLWLEVPKETGRGKGYFKIRDLFAD